MKWKKCLMNIFNLQVHLHIEKDEIFNLSELIENYKKI